jgi:hypothetical protein
MSNQNTSQQKVLISTIITTFKFFEKDSDNETEELDSFIFVLTKKVKF